MKKIISKLNLVIMLVSSFYSCTRFEPELEKGQIFSLLYSGNRIFQYADIPYSITTLFTNEKGAADLDGVGETASYVNLSSIQFFNDTLYILDNTRKIFPKLKTFNPSSNEIRTIGALSTSSKSIVDMVLTTDGHFFLANDKIFYYSSMEEIERSIPTQTFSFNFIQDEYFNFTKIKIDTFQKKLYLLNQCKLYMLSYLNLNSTITLPSAIYNYPGCSFSSGNNIKVNNFAVDSSGVIYLCHNIYLQYVTLPDTLKTLYSNDNPQSYADLSCHLNKNEIFFTGNNFSAGGFRDTYSKNRLYNIQLSTYKINLLAGGVYSTYNSFSKDGIGTFSGFQNIIYMTFDPKGTIFFIDNFTEYKSTNQILIQKIRKATKI